MKILKPIKGFLVWTGNCIEVWLFGLKNVVTTDTVYWSQTQNYFRNREEREKYLKAEKELFEKLTLTE